MKGDGINDLDEYMGNKGDELSRAQYNKGP
jgi:hypothetical protein